LKLRGIIDERRSLFERLFPLLKVITMDKLKLARKVWEEFHIGLATNKFYSTTLAAATCDYSLFAQ